MKRIVKQPSLSKEAVKRVEVARDEVAGLQQKLGELVEQEEQIRAQKFQALQLIQQAREKMMVEVKGAIKDAGDNPEDGTWWLDYKTLAITRG